MGEVRFLVRRRGGPAPGVPGPQGGAAARLPSRAVPSRRRGRGNPLRPRVQPSRRRAVGGAGRLVLTRAGRHLGRGRPARPPRAAAFPGRGVLRRARRRGAAPHVAARGVRLRGTRALGGAAPPPAARVPPQDPQRPPVALRAAAAAHPRRALARVQAWLAHGDLHGQDGNSAARERQRRPGKGLATRLLQGLAAQLRGTLSRSPGEDGFGTLAVLRFPVAEPGP